MLIVVLTSDLKQLSYYARWAKVQPKAATSQVKNPAWVDLMDYVDAAQRILPFSDIEAKMSVAILAHIEAKLIFSSCEMDLRYKMGPRVCRILHREDRLIQNLIL